MSQEKEESIFQHVGRVCQNAFTKCFGFAQTADELAKIKLKEHQIESRKKNFGVAYLNLLNETATPAALQSCIDTALADIAVLQADIVTLQAEVDRVNNVTKEKIVPKPSSGGGGGGGGGGRGAAATTTTTTAPAATTPATATTTEPTVASPPPVEAPAESVPSTTTTTSPVENPDEVGMQEVSLEPPK
jgi:hypothetical protein